ncbi:thioesterase family protein [Pseudooceanicola sp.]|uniref:thioesterase family protein n=1 Tax=Pseudooceanicola sp. TaxID=1914328 RepID=UPI00261E2C76|nr:thioesterase family protein [Pseudooceanicola sp.]MDF1855646.1 thioesterase family protein [Pseudooceanicola sp.]
MSIQSATQTLKPEWIDHNGHLNMAYYGVLFDWGVDAVQDSVGLGIDYARSSGFTTFSGEFHIRYLRELPPDASVYSTFRLLDVGPKAYHFCQELYHSDGWLSATGEGISLHIDQSGPRVAPYPAPVLAALQAMLAEHSQSPVPDWVGRTMGIRK